MQAIDLRKPGISLTRCIQYLVILFAASLAAGQQQVPTVTAESETPAVKTTPTPTPAATSGDGPVQEEDSSANADEKPKKEKRGSFVPIPIPINSPTFGTGMILGLGYVFQLKMQDKVSPPSAIGLVTAFTNSGTRGMAIGGHLYFSENKYQTKFAVAKGRANYDFYGIGLRPGQPEVSVNLDQSGSILFAEFMANLGKKIFVGPRYQYRKLKVTVGGVTTPGGFEVPSIDLNSTTAAIGFKVERDLRDSTFYPRKGSQWSFTADFFGKALGSNRTYQTYKVAYNGYLSLGKRQVLAYHGSGCSVSDNAPFFDLCFFGANSDLRGYTAGQFQNRRMFTAQAEYRRELPYRLGFVAFAGFGGVARRWSDFQFDELLPAAGVGLRFKLDKKNHINYRVDWGIGRAGYTLSMSVTEAF